MTLIEQLAEALGADQASVAEAVAHARAKDADLKKALKFHEEQERDNAPLLYEFEVAGEPSAAKRPQRRNPIGDKGEKKRFMFDPDDSVKLTLGERFKQEIPKGFVQLQGEAEVDLLVYRSPPASFPPYKLLLAELGFVRPTKAPDFDNYTKLIIDSIRHILFRDDAQIVIGNTYKFYSMRPRAILRIACRPHKMFS